MIINKLINDNAPFKELIGVCLLILTLMSISCAKQQPPQNKQVPITVYKVEKEPVQSSLDYVSSLFSRKSANIQPRVSGPVTNIYVKDGQYVTINTPLLSIESSEQQAVVSTGKANIETASQDVKQSKATLMSYIAQKEAKKSEMELQKINYNRTKALYDDGSETQANLDTAVNQYNQAQSDLKALDEQIIAQKKLIDVKKSQYNASIKSLGQTQAQLGYYVLRAPYNGYVGHVAVNVGDLISSGDIVTTITENKNLEIKIAVDSDYRDKLKKGLIVKLLDSSGKTLASGTVYFISPLIDPKTQTIMVNAKINNPDGFLRTGETINARLIIGESLGIKIPAEAVINYAGENFVYLAKTVQNQLIASQTPVTLGELSDNKYVVLKGLKVGDNLIVGGIQKLKDKTPVTLKKL